MNTIRAYVNHTPNSGYVDSKGFRHVFVKQGNLGILRTADAKLIEELDAAVRSGAPFRDTNNEVKIDTSPVTPAVLAREAIGAVSSSNKLAELKAKLSATADVLEQVPQTNALSEEQLADALAAVGATVDVTDLADE